MVGIVPGILNVALDWTFVFPLKMGIAGSSIATTICCAIAAAMVYAYMLRKAESVHLYRLKFSVTSLYLTFRNLYYMARNGFSSLLGELAMSVLMLTGNYVFIKALGDDGVAAFSVACYLYPIVFMVNSAVAQSAQPIISYNHGALLEGRVNEAYRLSVKTALICGTACMAILMIGSRPLISLFLDKGTPAYDYAISGLPIFACASMFFALNIDIIGYYQAVEDNKRAKLYMLLRGLVFLVPSFLLFPILLPSSGMWCAVPVAEALTLVIILFTSGHSSNTAQ